MLITAKYDPKEEMEALREEAWSTVLKRELKEVLNKVLKKAVKKV